MCQFKVKDPESNKHPIAIGNIANSADLSGNDIEIDYMEMFTIFL